MADRGNMAGAEYVLGTPGRENWRPRRPARPLKVDDKMKLVFGPDVRIHEITGLPIAGGLPVARQLQLHCEQIEKEEGREAADAVRKLLGPQPPNDPEANNAAIIEARRQAEARERELHQRRLAEANPHWKRPDG